MKHCPKSQEPGQLKRYRQSHPQDCWDDFRDHCASGLDEVYHQLRKDQGGLCVYCETKVDFDNRQVEHFHDKSDESDPQMPTRWHLDWNNMWYACRGGTHDTGKTCDYMPPVKENLSCGQYKPGGAFARILAPSEIPAFPRLFRYEQKSDAITIHPDDILCREAGIDVERVQETIDLLNLNCRCLCVSRLAALKPVLRTISNYHPDQEQFYLLAKRFLGRQNDGMLKQFFTMFRWNFKKVAEEYLNDIQYAG